MYKEVNLLDQTDAAYIAGLIDGEGTVTLSRRHRNKNRQLVVSISNTDRPLLEYVGYSTLDSSNIATQRFCRKASNQIVIGFAKIHLIPAHLAKSNPGVIGYCQILPLLCATKAKLAVAD